MSGPLKEPFEIKVYEIDDVERLQRRRQEEIAEVSRGDHFDLFSVSDQGRHMCEVILDLPKHYLGI